MSEVLLVNPDSYDLFLRRLEEVGINEDHGRVSWFYGVPIYRRTKVPPGRILCMDAVTFKRLDVMGELGTDTTEGGSGGAGDGG